MLTIYKASAGSGKTYNLAYEYIKALLTVKNKETGHYRLNHRKYATPLPFQTLDREKSGYMHNRHRAILAITFTNKATEEMKTRIIRELAALTSTTPRPDGTDPSPYAAGLMACTGCTRHELAESADIALNDLLYDYHFFNVSTIDSFFQNVLRTFARELDRPGDFEVELNDEYAVENGVDMLLDDFNFGVVSENGRIGQWIQQYMLNFVEQGKNFNVLNRSGALHKSLVNYALEISKETFKTNSHLLREYLNRSDREGLLPRYLKALKERRIALLAQVKDMASRTLTNLAGMGVSPESINNTLRNRIEVFMLGETAPKPDDLDLTKATFADVLSPDVRKPANYVKAAAAKNTDAILAVKSLFTGAYRIYLEYWLLNQLNSSAQNMGLLGYVWNYVERFRTDNNLVLLSDTNDLLRRIIDRSETPFIYEKLGVELRHFLIDEFQDTSTMQWDNLKPLVATGLDEENDSLIIGDEKQSIYRFRNSDSSLLRSKVADEDFPTRHTTRGMALEENTNYRSSPAVVRFNNTLFTLLAPTLDIDGYSNVVQDIPAHHLDMPGYINFRAITKDDDPLELMAAEIIRQHDSGKYRWGDIAVLVNTNKEGINVVTHLLKEYPDIPVISDESLMLNKSKGVNIVISVMKIIERIYQAAKPTVTEPQAFPGKRDIAFMLSRFEYLYSRGIPADEALALALDPTKGGEPSSGGDPLLTSNAITANIDTILARRPSTLVALAEVIIAETISPEDRNADMAYLVALQDVIIEYTSRYGGDLRSFLRWWDANAPKLTVPSSPTHDAVNVMTIHKSKGLEFGCIILPFASWSIEPREENIWVDTPDIEGVPAGLKPPMIRLPNSDLLAKAAPSLKAPFEENKRAQRNDCMNKTYVAYTRPVYELVAFYDPAKNIGGNLTAAFAKGAPAAMPGREDLFISLRDHYDPETQCLTIGTPTVNPDSDKDETAAEPTPNLPKIQYFVAYRDDTRNITTVDSQVSDPAVMLLQPDGASTADPDGVDDSVTPTAGNPSRLTPTAEEEAARRGNILHDVLSHVRDPKDLPRAVCRTARRFRLSADEREDALRTLSEAFERNMAASPKIVQWFGDAADCRNEQSVYDPERDEIKRIDRLVTLPDGSMEIIDFKFTASTKHPEHREQVIGYVNLLRRMGNANVKGYLWYPLLDTVVEC